MKNERCGSGRMPNQLSPDHYHDENHAWAAESGQIVSDENIPVNLLGHFRQPIASYQHSSVSLWTQSPQRHNADHGISSHSSAPSTSNPSFWVPPRQHPEHPDPRGSSKYNGIDELSNSAPTTSGNTSEDWNARNCLSRI